MQFGDELSLGKMCLTFCVCVCVYLYIALLIDEQILRFKISVNEVE